MLAPGVSEGGFRHQHALPKRVMVATPTTSS